MKVFNYLIGLLRNIFALLFYIVITVGISLPFITFGWLQQLVSNKKLQAWFNAITQQLGYFWCDAGSFLQRVLLRTEYEVISDVKFSRDKSYFLISNHLSGVDIIVHQKILQHKTPLTRYLIKTSLLKIPFFGWCFRAWCIPMQRYGKSVLAKRPELRRKDVDRIMRMSECIKDRPFLVASYIEGTRFTELKRYIQDSPYQYLLKPKIAGVAYVLGAFGKRISSILDVTFCYYDKDISLWDYFFGRIRKITIVFREIPITPDLLGDYENDLLYRKHLQTWLNQLWTEKDALLKRLHERSHEV